MLDANDDSMAELREALPVALLALRRRVFNDTAPSAGEMINGFALADPDLQQVNSRLVALVHALLAAGNIAVRLLADAYEENTIEECLETLCSVTTSSYYPPDEQPSTSG
jgi:hypothetical protein